MIVSPSRAHAVRYLFLLREYCKKMGYTDVNALVAFSGTVKYQGEEYTESKLNSTDDQKISEKQLPLFFNSDMYNVLIVADKYQTGFDEPLLHTMFVDKKLRGVKAVQTLSRLNRSCKGKTDTYILDFINTADGIKASFQPFYEETLLSDAVDVNMVYEYDTELKKYHLWNTDDEEKVYQLFAKRKQGDKDMGKLASALKPALNAYEAYVEEEQFKIRSLLKNFIRFYAYMAQVVRTFDRELYKTYIFAEYFYRIIPKNAHQKVDLSNKLALINNKLTETFSGSIELNPTAKDKTVNPEKGTQGKKPEVKTDLLANIIDKINIMYAGKFTEADRVIVETIYDKMLKSSKTLKKQAKSNDAQMFETSIFPKEFDKIAQSCYMEQMDAFSKLFEDEQFYKRVMGEMAKAMYLNYRNSEIGESRISMAAEPDPANMIPLYTLRAACGRFEDGELPKNEGYVEVSGLGFKPDRERHFAIHAMGRSMEPKINDGDICVFEWYKGGSREGDIVLTECPNVDPDTGCRYTIKKYHSEKVEADGSWEHSKVELLSLNPDYDTIELNDVDGYRTIGIFKGIIK